MSELNVVAATQPPAPPPPPPPAEQAVAPAAPTTEQVEQKTEGESAAPKPATEDDPAKASRRLQKRIDAANRRFGEEKARRELLEAELEKLKAPKAPPQQGEPRLEQFDDIEKYAEAKAEWRKTQALKEFETKQRTEAQRAKVQGISKAWEERIATASEKYEDFEDVVGEIRPTNPVSIAIMRAENGEDVAYHLAKNQKEALRLMSLEPMDQILEIGRLSAKLALQPPVVKAPSKAPPPITPVTTGAAPASEGPSEDDDTATWIRKRNKQVHGKK